MKYKLLLITIIIPIVIILFFMNSKNSFAVADNSITTINHSTASPATKINNLGVETFLKKLHSAMTFSNFDPTALNEMLKQKTGIDLIMFFKFIANVVIKIFEFIIRLIRLLLPI